MKIKKFFSMEENKDIFIWILKNIWNLISAYYYIVMACIGGFLALMLKTIKYGKKASKLEVFSKVGLAGFLGWIAYRLPDFLIFLGLEGFENMSNDLRGILSGSFGLLSEPIYNNAPAFFGNLIKGKINKNSCKVDGSDN